MRIDENKLDELLKNEMNPTEGPAFRVGLPQKKPVYFPKWAGAVAACLAVTIIGTATVLSLNKPATEAKVLPDNNKDRENATDIEIIPYKKEEDGVNCLTDEEWLTLQKRYAEEFNKGDAIDKPYEKWLELMYNNLVKIDEDKLPQVLASANFSQNTNRSENTLEQTKTYKGVTLTSELYDLLTISSLSRTEQYAIQLIGCSMTNGSYLEYDEDAPAYDDFVWEGKTVREWFEIQNKAYEEERIFNYILELKALYDSGEYDRYSYIKEKMMSNLSEEICEKYSLGWTGTFDGERFLNDDDITIDFDRVVADLEQAEKDRDESSAALEQANESYREQYAHEVTPQVACTVEDLFRMMDENGFTTLKAYLVLPISMSSTYNNVVIPMTLDEFEAFIEKAAQNERMSEVVYGLATR